MTRLRAALLSLVALSFVAGYAHAGADEQVAAWVPAPILATLVLLGFAALAKWIAKRLDALESAIAGLHAFATKDELKNLGDRLDSKNANLRERVAVIEAVIERVTE